MEAFLSETHITTSRKHLTTIKDIKNEINKIKIKKAPGPDEIENILIKNLSQKTIRQLTYIINAIITLQHFPNTWKLATVIPVPKPNKEHTLLESYRPISLLNALLKITERIIYNKLNLSDEKYHKIIPAQFGFRNGHSTVQQIARITNDISVEYNRNNVTTMLLLDIEKAFDRVWKEGLLYKMIHAQYPPHLIKLISNYLTERKYHVKIGNATSQVKAVNAGVPQGSVLGPRLFLYYINDIPDQRGTKLALFADDTAIHAHSFSAVVAAKRTQMHIDELERYYKKWKINGTNNIHEKTQREQDIYTDQYI